MKIRWLALGALATGWLVCAALLASTGAFSIDETIYSAMIERFATSGELTIPNGYENHPSESLLIRFLVPGPHGLVPQYPSGYAVLAAPFFLLGGLQGVIVLNALAASLSLFVVYLLAKTLFDDRELALNAAVIFGFSGYVTEYALGIWPHAVSILFVVVAAYCAALSLDEQRERGWPLAVLAGLAVGLGATLRVDVIIAAPVLAVWLFGSARRPLAWTGALALGVGGGLAVSAWLNHMKFGGWSPISYGHGLGATGLRAYLPLLPLGLAAVAGAASFAVPRVRKFLLGRRGMLMTAGAVIILLLFPWTQAAGLRVLRGLNVLLVDVQAHPGIDNLIGAQRIGEGPVLLFGLLKKALFQSLPFLGFAIQPLAGLYRRERRAAFALCWLLPAVWMIPFAYYSWYGGMASNMRYFLPTLPFLSILAAVAWREIRAQASVDTSRALTGAVALLVTVWIAYRLSQADREALVFAGHLVIPGALLTVAAVTALLWISTPVLRPRLRQPATVVFAAGLAWSAYTSLFFDPMVAQIQRRGADANYRTFSAIEPNAHVVAEAAESFLFQLQRKDATLAVYARSHIPVDFGLIEAALRHDRPVYAQSSAVANAVNAHGRYMAAPLSSDPKGLYRITRISAAGVPPRTMTKKQN